MKGSLKWDQQLVVIPAGEVRLEGDLAMAPEARAMVLFAHGSGSSRHSARNRFVAQVLQRAHLATLLFDLLSPQEEQRDLRTGHLRFDIPLLARRLVCAIDWAASQPQTKELRIGLFGASTGAAAALAAAACRAGLAAAVVSRGGRPDLAGQALAQVVAPTLLIVGADDTAVLDLNRQALGQLRCAKELKIIPGATHLFEEPGTLEQVAELARQWFSRYLVAAAAPPAQ